MKLFKLTLHHIRRSPFQSLIAFVAVFLSFSVLNTFVYLNRGLNHVLNYFETKPEITIFLKDGLDAEKITALEEEIKTYPQIREIRKISKEKALELYREMNKNNPYLTEMVTASILPASIEISANDPRVLEVIAQKFSSKSEVDEVIYQKDIIQSLLNWTKIIRIFGIALVVIFLIASFLIIFSLIGMKITNRKDEIRISRLLGASQFYVKRPFLLEGAIYGTLGAFIAFLSSYLTIFAFRHSINHFFQPIIFVNEFSLLDILILIAELLFGLVIGLSASWLGARRYIKW